MKFCSQCGAVVQLEIPKNDNRERFVCSSCDFIHYQNPNVIAGTIPCYVEGDEPKILLCKRAIEPRLGYWTLPAGFLENGETLQDGAIRETVEESCAEVTDVALFSILNVAQSNQIHVFFRATLVEPKFSATTESLEVRLFSFSEIPWKQLAFPTVYKTLEAFKTAYHQQIYDVFMDDVTRNDWTPLDH